MLVKLVSGELGEDRCVNGYHCTIIPYNTRTSWNTSYLKAPTFEQRYSPLSNSSKYIVSFFQIASYIFDSQFGDSSDFLQVCFQIIENALILQRLYEMVFSIVLIQLRTFRHENMISSILQALKCAMLPFVPVHTRFFFYFWRGLKRRIKKR